MKRMKSRKGNAIALGLAALLTLTGTLGSAYLYNKIEQRKIDEASINHIFEINRRKKDNFIQGNIIEEIIEETEESNEVEKVVAKTISNTKANTATNQVNENTVTTSHEEANIKTQTAKQNVYSKVDVAASTPKTEEIKEEPKEQVVKEQQEVVEQPKEETKEQVEQPKEEVDEQPKEETKEPEQKATEQQTEQQQEKTEQGKLSAYYTTTEKSQFTLGSSEIISAGILNETDILSKQNQDTKHNYARDHSTCYYANGAVYTNDTLETKIGDAVEVENTSGLLNRMFDVTFNDDNEKYAYPYYQDDYTNDSEPIKIIYNVMNDSDITGKITTITLD